MLPVSCGVLGVFSHPFQLPESGPNPNTSLDRGRVYVASGTGMVYTLYELRRAVGRGHSQEARRGQEGEEGAA